MQIAYLSDIRFPLERANGIQTAETCHALARRGHTVTLIVRPDTASEPRDPLDFYGLPPCPRLQVVRVPARGARAMRRLAYLGAAFRHASRGRFDLVFTRDLGVASALLRVPRRRRAPLVYESHGLAWVVGATLGTLLSTAASASSTKQQRLLRRDRRVWSAADGYVTITHALAEDLQRAFGRREHLVVVPDGVRLPQARRFTPPPVHAEPTAVYAGHLYPWKGVDTLLQALKHTASVRALIVGGHPAEPDLARLQQLAATLGIEDRVTFTGFVPPPTVADYLAEGDILVLPNSASAVSARYTSPLKLFEYLAAGRPIVASDLPALGEALRHGSNALLVPPDDPGALAEAIVRLVEDRELSGRLARQAFDDAAQYGWDARAGRLEALFTAVTTTARAPA